MKICHIINIIVQNTGQYASSINDKSESPNKTLANITRALILKSSHKKELWWFAYKYAICLSRLTENILRGENPYFLCHETRPSYHHIKIWGLIVYIINVHLTIKNLDDRSRCGYFMGYSATTGVIIYWKPDQKCFYTQIPSCLFWWIQSSSLHRRQAQSMFFIT